MKAARIKQTAEKLGIISFTSFRLNVRIAAMRLKQGAGHESREDEADSGEAGDHLFHLLRVEC